MEMERLRGLEHIRLLLYTCRYGYGFVWQAQCVGDVEPCIAEFNCRVSKRNWFSDICNSPELDTYLTLILELCVEKISRH